METAICPQCNKEIVLEQIVKKFFSGKAKSKSFMENLATGVMSQGNVAYICPECNKIIGIAQ